MTDVVIVGASHSGIAAAAALRTMGYEGSIAVLTDEAAVPYHRPPLSKDALSSAAFQPTPLRPEPFYKNNKVDLLQRMEVMDINLDERTLLASDGSKHSFDKLILACGAKPRRLPTAVDPQELALYLRTHDDVEELKKRFSGAQAIAIVGGGLIGVEVAAMAAAAGLRVTVIEPTERLMQRAVSPSVSTYLQGRHEAAGIKFLLGVSVTGIARAVGTTGELLTLSDGSVVDTDTTLAAIGVVPNDSLARAAGLEVANGILTSATGETAAADVFAIGDCAAWLDPELGAHVRSEAVNPGMEQAKIVASAIAGKPAPERAVGRLWSHQGPIRLQMAGEVNSATSEAVLKAAASGAFSVLGFKENRLVAVQSINDPQQFTKLFDLIGSTREDVAGTLDVEFPPPRH
ncbi:MAG: FAD-dependent oxidoreductase [Rhizobiaceae bacterium]|nr:FAD-dependent oxidoreductase [Rhizobiaceae bacterium]